jgi:hypothetical protein
MRANGKAFRQRILTGLLVFASWGDAAASVVLLDLSGAELPSAPNVLLPVGSGDVSGTSLTAPTNRADYSVFVSIDLGALGFGPGGYSAGSVAVTNTRLEGASFDPTDSDLWFGLWDGAAFLAYTSFDGYQSADQSACGASSDGTTFLHCGAGAQPFVADQGFGQSATATYRFDLVQGWIAFVLNGVSYGGTLPEGFRLDALGFLIGLGNAYETHRIDRVEVTAVPLPSSLGLVGVGLLLAMRYRG